jgi:hypothetical protein
MPHELDDRMAVLDFAAQEAALANLAAGLRVDNDLSRFTGLLANIDSRSAPHVVTGKIWHTLQRKPVSDSELQLVETEQRVTLQQQQQQQRRRNSNRQLQRQPVLDPELQLVDSDRVVKLQQHQQRQPSAGNWQQWRQ